MNEINFKNFNDSKEAINNTCILLSKNCKYYFVTFILWVISIIGTVVFAIVSKNDITMLFVFGVLFFIFSVFLIYLNSFIIKRFQDLNKISSQFNECYKLSLLGFIFGIPLIIGILKFFKRIKLFYKDILNN